MKVSTNCTRPQYVCANEVIKLIGSTDGYFPDFGHHLENEMGGLWLYPIKLLDGFWMHFKDCTTTLASCYMKADQFINYYHKNEFLYFGGLGHTTITAKREQIAFEDISGIVVTYEFTNNSNETHLCETEFLSRINLRPVWLSEEIDIIDGTKDEMEYDSKNNVFIAKDNKNPWYCVIGTSEIASEKRSGDFFGPEITSGNGTSCGISHKFSLDSHEKKVIKFYIAGSYLSKEDAMAQYDKMIKCNNGEEEKIAKYESIRKDSELIIEDKEFQNIFNWVKVNTDWLKHDGKELGKGIMAGIPEYPWWFGCDSFYTLQGILCIGDFEICRTTLDLILYYSQKLNGNGRIVHEILPNGYCPNYGNTQETAHFITMVWKYCEWTGDFEFLIKAYDYIEKSIKWLFEQDDDNDLFPSGYGIIEIAGLNMEMIDTAVYTCEAYFCFSKICTYMKEDALSQEYEAIYKRLKAKINSELWDEEVGLYCDAFASYDTIKNKKDIILSQLDNAKSEEIKNYIYKLLKDRENNGKKEEGWLLNRNWVICTPMEVGIADKEKADRALKKLKEKDYTGKYGAYLDGLKQDATMTISTGAFAVAHAVYGDSNEALDLIEKIFHTFSAATPGAISEMSPDYGCFVQAWTTYSVMLPIIRHFIGIKPSASSNTIYFEPCIPSKWNKVSMNHVKVFHSYLSVMYEKENGITKIKIKNPANYNLEINMEEEITVNNVRTGKHCKINESEIEIVYSKRRKSCQHKK